jgi:membrane fusion protein, multidrug efflux system
VSLTVPALADKAMTGVVEAIEPKIDPDTRNVLVRALIPNSEFALVPGMSVTVTVATGAPQKYVTLPQSSIVYNPYGASVYVVDMGRGDAGRRVRQRFVGAGETRGDQVAILSGIGAGEWVVTSGQLKLKNGDQVVINNSVTPPNEPQPQPREQ